MNLFISFHFQISPFHNLIIAGGPVQFVKNSAGFLYSIVFHPNVCFLRVVRGWVWRRGL